MDEAHYKCSFCDKWFEDFGEMPTTFICDNCTKVTENAAQQSVQLTALWRVLAVSIFINVVLLAVVLFTIGGN